MLIFIKVIIGAGINTTTELSEIRSNLHENRHYTSLETYKWIVTNT